MTVAKLKTKQKDAPNRGQINAKKAIQSLRYFGYTPSTAIGDIIDNSYDANAVNVVVEVPTEKMNPYGHIAIYDDGDGMSLGLTQRALELGSATDHSSEDLGTFGLGMKIAAISMGRVLNVITKTRKGKYCCGELSVDTIIRENDFVTYTSAHNSLDKMQKWAELHDMEYLAKLIPSAKFWFDNHDSGTIVLISNLDKYTGQKKGDKLRGKLKTDLGKTFSRIIRDFSPEQDTLSDSSKVVELFSQRRKFNIFVTADVKRPDWTVAGVVYPEEMSGYDVSKEDIEGVKDKEGNFVKAPLYAKFRPGAQWHEIILKDNPQAKIRFRFSALDAHPKKYTGDKGEMRKQGLHISRSGRYLVTESNLLTFINPQRGGIVAELDFVGSETDVAPHINFDVMKNQINLSESLKDRLCNAFMVFINETIKDRGYRKVKKICDRTAEGNKLYLEKLNMISNKIDLEGLTFPEKKSRKEKSSKPSGTRKRKKDITKKEKSETAARLGSRTRFFENIVFDLDHYENEEYSDQEFFVTETSTLESGQVKITVKVNTRHNAAKNLLEIEEFAREALSLKEEDDSFEEKDSRLLSTIESYHNLVHSLIFAQALTEASNVNDLTDEQQTAYRKTKRKMNEKLDRIASTGVSI